MKHDIWDIVLYNIQGAMDVGIIVRITKVNNNDDDVIYTMQHGLDVRGDQITKLLGNADKIQDEINDVEYESEDKKPEPKSSSEVWNEGGGKY